MNLVYIDESGINYKRAGGQFKDGPYIVWCGILVSESKYFHLERLFYSLCKKVLGIKNWENTEIHASDIWGGKGNFANLSRTKARKYFEELIQLLSKLDIHVVIGIRQKGKTVKSKKTINKEIELAAYAFLHGVEQALSQSSETGVLIADQWQEGGSGYSILEVLFRDRVKWRYNPGAEKRFKIKPKYQFESQSCFLLDQIHYVDSKESLFVQIVDSATFVFKRVFIYDYLEKFSVKSPQKSDVPISVDTFGLFADKVSINWYDDNEKDVSMNKLYEYVDKTKETYIIRITTPFAIREKQVVNLR